MSDNTGIEWTDATWNPIRGCSRVSEGCRHCYAERVAARFSGPGQPYEGLAVRKLRVVSDDEQTTVGRWTGAVRMVPEHLADPLRWRRPRRVFVNSMSDLFHESLADDQRDRVLAVMLLAPHHTFQVLTKRAAVMRRYLSDPDLYKRVLRAADAIRDRFPHKHLSQIGIANPSTSPARWIWWGVSVENQAAADERIPELLRTPAAVRWLSCEPLLGPVDLLPWFDPTGACDCPPGESYCVGGCAKRASWRHTEPDGEDPNLDWVVMGAESGPGARAADPEWFLELAEQCEDARVPLFFKQGMPGDNITAGDGSKVKAGGIIGLPYLDGRQHVDMPEARRG